MAHIIIADDDDLMIDIVRTVLEREGHVVGALPDGRAVIRVVELKRPDLVILDCGMPERCGITALLDIRRSKTAFRTPVLMLTARNGRVDEEIAMRAGADDYLRKPFDPDQLIVRVDAVIARRAARKTTDGDHFRHVRTA